MKQSTQRAAKHLRRAELFPASEDGVLLAGMYDESPRIIPETKMQEFLASHLEKNLERSTGHYEEFILACKGERGADERP